MEETITYILPFMDLQTRKTCRLLSKHIYSVENSIPLEALNLHFSNARRLQSSRKITTRNITINGSIPLCTDLIVYNADFHVDAPRLKNLFIEDVWRHDIHFQIPNKVKYLSLMSCACNFTNQIQVGKSVADLQCTQCVLNRLDIKRPLRSLFVYNCGACEPIGVPNVEYITLRDAYINRLSFCGSKSTKFENCTFQETPLLSNDTTDLAWINCNAIPSDFVEIDLPMLDTLNFGENHTLREIPVNFKKSNLTSLNIVHTRIDYSDIDYPGLNSLVCDMKPKDFAVFNYGVEYEYLEICVKSMVDFADLVQFCKKVSTKHIKIHHCLLYNGCARFEEDCIRAAMPNTLCEFQYCRMAHV